ncbi:hypothetical protein HPB47_016378 [Ixodes persulcatus]|uniref:Uncharacterized protein n=1 Tax=Ixodes persulcatus TaxID=34615 RepID=A0AC60QRZ9_IXOPE|nr:hypothetical protein HPB47_016378 [Ixodes persulcatus]
MGWSTHQKREARSKLQYMGRLKFLPEENYARRMYYEIRYKGTRTNWIKKLKAMDSKYSGDTNRQQATTEREWAKTIRKEVTQGGIQQWQRAIQRKRGLSSTESTRSRKCELYGDDSTCRLCGEEKETIEHVVSRCRRLEHTRKNSPSDSLERALGLTDADDGTQRKTEDTGRRLVIARPAGLQTTGPCPEAMSRKAEASVIGRFAQLPATGQYVLSAPGSAWVRNWCDNDDVEANPAPAMEVVNSLMVLKDFAPCLLQEEERHDGVTDQVMRIDVEESSAITVVLEDHFIEVMNIVSVDRAVFRELRRRLKIKERAQSESRQRSQGSSAVKFVPDTGDRSQRLGRPVEKLQQHGPHADLQKFDTLKEEYCGQDPAWNPFALTFARVFAQLSALSTTEPEADPAADSA